jgi:hypothetical protein
MEARVYDPLWLLAKQWQLGEFTAEDAGSPLKVRARLEQSPLTRFHPGPLPTGPVAGTPYDPARIPLEVRVEREPLGAPDLRRACDTGLRFLRLLSEAGAGPLAGAFAAAYRLPPPPDGAPLGPESERLLRVAAGRVPDGTRLEAALRGVSSGLPPEPEVPPELRESVLEAVKAWLAWLDSRADPSSADEGPSAWNPERMEYSFAVAAPGLEGSGERVLAAAEYPGGHLDWYAFDLHPQASLGAAAEPERARVLDRTAIPSPVAFRGMPVSRWWEFEDGQVNLATVDAGPTDLLRLLLLGFSLDYGNDWFLVPVELPTGAIYRVASLVVTDSFGIETLVRPYTQAVEAGQRWRAFGLTQAADLGGQADDHLFLPPTLPLGLHGEAIEEVLLLRDEVANLGWAVERRVADAGGRPLDRFEQYQRKKAAAAAAAAANPAPGAGDAEGSVPDESTEIRYRLANSVPDYWFPLVATRTDPGAPDIRLVRGRMLRSTDDGEGEAAVALGRLLEPDTSLSLFEEEVSRSGERVVRGYQYVRWTDGGTHLWIGRRKQPGRGEGASGLRFDSLIGL